MQHLPVDVVDAEANAFEVKRSDCAVERLGLFQERFELSGVRRISAQERDQVGEALLRRVTAVSGHVGTIVECRGRSCASTSPGRDRVNAWIEDARVSSPRISAKKAA